MSLVEVPVNPRPIAGFIGTNGRESVLEDFLSARHLLHDVELYDDLLATEWGSEPLSARG